MYSNKKTPFKKEFIPTIDIEFDKVTGIITLGDKYCKIVNVTVNQSDSVEELFKSILPLQFEFDICQNISLEQELKSKDDINRKIKFNESLGSKFATGIKNEDLYNVRELVENEIIRLFNYSCYIKIFSNDKEQLLKNTTEMINSFSTMGVTALDETVNCKWAYLSSLSDYYTKDSRKTGLFTRKYKTDQRKVPVTNENIADFCPLFNSYKDEESNAFGNEPVARFKNLSGLIYNFNFHIDNKSTDPLGHTLVMGGTGAGKSTLIALLLMLCQKYERLLTLAFDSKQGLRVPITIFDGNYTDACDPNQISLNPFTLEENLQNRQFLAEFLKILAGGADLNEQAILEEVIRQNYEALGNTGSLKKLEMVFGIKKQKEGKPNIAKRLEKWINDKDLSKYFNNDKDSLIFDKRINCFDMGDILENESILIPLASYIFHSFDQLIKKTRSPHAILMDELPKYLLSEHFSVKITEILKQTRKLDGIFIGCIQQPSDILKNSYIDKSTFLENIATLIIFPNIRANKQDYQEFGLNDNEFSFVKSGSSRQALIKKGERSSIIDTDLTILGKYLKCFSSSASNLPILEEALKNNNKDWVETFLNKAK